jgi:hypothetical protein
MDHLKQWLQTRCTWVDGQFVAPPQIVPAGDHVEAGTTVTLVNPRSSGVLYYTLDGSDPRPPWAPPGLIETVTLVPENAAKRVLVPTGPVDNAWRTDLGFDDSAWISGAGGVGYDRDPTYKAYFSIDVGHQMDGGNPSCYIRIPFAVSGDPKTFNAMTLRVRYDDGFVAYLNGVEIGRALFLGEPAWNSRAYSNHDDFEAVIFQEANLSAHAGLLKQGQNLLAIQAMNSSTTSSDFLLSVELVAGRTTSPTDNGMSEAVHTYTGPITITESTQIKARVLVGSNPYSPWSGLAEAIFDVGPAPQSVRINEIMYHPASEISNLKSQISEAEYVELLNTAEAPITLYDAIRSLPWRFTDNPEKPAIELLFPAEPPVTLAPGECLLLVRNLDALQTVYDVPAGVQILEWGNGKLANSGETLRIECPGDEDVAGVRLWALADSVTYNDGSHPESFATGVDPWPTAADGRGMALHRIDPRTDGSNPANWRAAPPSPGVAE